MQRPSIAEHVWASRAVPPGPTAPESGSDAKAPSKRCEQRAPTACTGREGERHLYPESYLLDSLTVSVGGRAAERLVLGEVSTGASNDLACATQLATRMVREFGMSDRLGPVGFSDESPQYLGGVGNR